MRLIGTSLYTSVMSDAPRLFMVQAIEFFMMRGQVVRDVPGDGNCAIHSVAAAFAAWLGRPTMVQEIRPLLVTAWRYDARCQKELVRELKTEIAAGKLPESATTDDLLAIFARNGAFLPPILVAIATFFYTSKSVHVYGLSDMGRKEDPVLLYDEDGPADYTILFCERQRHFCVVLDFPRQMK